MVKQPTVSQSAKPGHLNGQCLREKSSYPDWTADEPRGKLMPASAYGASFRFGNAV